MLRDDQMYTSVSFDWWKGLRLDFLWCMEENGRGCGGATWQWKIFWLNERTVFYNDFYFLFFNYDHFLDFVSLSS